MFKAQKATAYGKCVDIVITSGKHKGRSSDLEDVRTLTLFLKWKSFGRLGVKRQCELPCVGERDLALTAGDSGGTHLEAGTSVSSLLQ